MEHELLGSESDESICALIARGRHAENDGSERGKCTSVGRCCPRNEILYILAIGGGQDGKEKSRGRLTSVAGRGDNAQRALADPATAPFVSKRRTPTAATHYLSGRTAPVGDRAGPNDQKNSRAVIECVVHRDQAIGIDDDLFRELFRIERGMQRATLLLTSRPGDAAVENSRKYGARLRDLAEGARNQLSDDVCGAASLPGRNRGLWSVDGGQNLALGGADEDAGLRSATVDANYDLTHSSDLPRSARGG
jgi:hypothetical protein